MVNISLLDPNGNIIQQWTFTEYSLVEENRWLSGTEKDGSQVELLVGVGYTLIIVEPPP